MKDHFWVYFIDPDHDVSVLDPQLGLGNWEALMDRSPLGNSTYEARVWEERSIGSFQRGTRIDAVWNGNKNESKCLVDDPSTREQHLGA